MRNVMQPFDPYSMRGATPEDDAVLKEQLSAEDIESELDLFEVDENGMLWFGRDRYVCDVVEVETGNGIWC